MSNQISRMTFAPNKRDERLHSRKQKRSAQLFFYVFFHDKCRNVCMLKHVTNYDREKLQLLAERHYFLWY